MEEQPPASTQINTPSEDSALQAPPALIPPSIEPSASNPKPKRAPKAAPIVDRPPGKSLLPISRVQKILKADKELPTCAREAVYLISVATEEFIKRLGQASQQQAMREKRTTVQHRDVATAVRRLDEFVFLEEIMASGVPTVSAAAPAKRKQKTLGSVPADPSTATTDINIKAAFERGKDKGDLGVVVDESVEDAVTHSQEPSNEMDLS